MGILPMTGSDPVGALLAAPGCTGRSAEPRRTPCSGRGHARLAWPTLIPPRAQEPFPRSLE